jgi:hypothetical protein
LYGRDQYVWRLPPGGFYKEQHMKTMQRILATGLLAAGALGVAGAAQARDVYWSLGVGAPGVAVGVGNAPVVYPQPVYVAPQPVYVRPRPVYAPPPVYYGSPRVVYRPAPVYYDYGRPGHHRHHRHHDGRHYRYGGY